MRRCTLLAAIVPLAFLPAFGQQTVTVKATSKTVSWGYYGSMHPAATVHSGDTVVMQTLSTCGPADRLIARGVKREDIPAYNDEVYQNYPAAEKGPGGHILTGPVEIVEAEPGDVLEVQILKVDIDANFACNGFGLHRGFLPMEFPYSRNRIIPLDREKMIGHFAPGIDIPLHPFFGSMGVAGTAGKIGSTEPFAHAGNMDNKELVAGTTLYIPVAAKGAMFEAGDGHAGQGNGEVDITAMETFLTGTFKFVVHKKKPMNWPRAETPTHYITMGFSPDLKEATEHALRDMIDFLVEEKHMKRDDAYMLSSVAVDLDITELVDGNVGVHAMCPKNIFTDSGTK
ncbi:acetamidase/formamidase family protein [Terriglobus albidus]|uniref:acetamidase/formamidase family protein n=1 Tax=Terriglobus albidus TaxID=1592106 RepID=UPI0021E0DD73|nr:acetamidase/formamidase family protein [Terriglobus albidus]